MKMDKIVREHINEKFTNDDSDPIHDLGIGMRHKVEEWLKTTRIISHITNPYIRNDLKINAKYVDISWPDLSDIPEYIRFGIIKGNFSCHFDSKYKLKQLPEKIESTLKIFINCDPDFILQDILDICVVDVKKIEITAWGHPKHENGYVFNI